jgi:TP901 family phage tail tape measure protein
VRTVGVKLTADVTQYVSGLQRAGAVTSAFSSEIDKAAKAGKLDKVAQSAAGLGLGLLGVAAATVKMRADFDKQMSAVQAATHAGAGEMDQLRAAALEAGKSTQFSATQAAQGVTELAKAGVSTANILGGGLKGALDLAAAGQLDVGEAAQTAASAMTQFKLSGDQVPHIADLLAAAAGKAQGSVHDMGYALNQSGLVAAQFGLSIEDTTGVLAEFASAGLLGSDAGTSFRTMLLAMANPTGQTRDKMKELGLSFYDAKGQFIGVAGVAQVLQDKLKGLTQEQRNQALGQIFGNDAIRAASILYTDGVAGVQKWKNGVQDAGYSTRTAAALTDNLAGDMERLKGSLETMAIEAGGGANDGLRVFTKTANAAVDAFSALPGGLQQTAVVMSGVAGASLLTAAGLIKVRGTAKDFMDELRDMGPLGTRTADGIGKIAGVAGKLGLVGLAVTGVFMGFKAFGDWVDKKHAPVRANIDDLTQSIKTFADTGKVTGELAAKYGDNLQKIGSAVSNVTKGMADLARTQADVAAGLSDPSIGENWNPVDPQAVQQIKDLNTALASLVSSGGASQARIFMQELASSGHLTAAQFAQLNTMLPDYTKAAGAAATANTGLALGFGSAKANAKTMTSGLQQAIEAGQKLTDVWNQLNGAVLGSDKAMLAAQNGIDAVKKSFQENGLAIAGNTREALNNRIAVGDSAKLAVAAAQAKYEETGSVDKASATYGQYISQLRKTMIQSGLTKTQADALLHTYADMPHDVVTKVSATGVPAVKAQLSGLLLMQEALKKGVSASAIQATNKNVAQGFADGGYTGPGSKYQPAGVVHAGEYVFNARATASLGVDNLDQMHQQAQRGYAGGGRVVWPFPTTAAMTRIPSKAEASSAVMPSFGSWPASPAAQRGDSGVWRSIVALIKSTGPISGSFGNAYRAGDPLWHGSGRAVDWMGFNQDALATFLAGKRPLELIHRTNTRDYAYTRGVNKGSFNNALMEAHRNHVHIAMQHGGVIGEPVVGLGASGRSYSFAENGPETVTPGAWAPAGRGGSGGVVVNVQAGYVVSEQQLQNKIMMTIETLQRTGRL